MDRFTKLIKSEIKRQYKSVRQFSEKSGIPYSTLSNALAKGVGGTSYDTVIKICKMLNLKQSSELLSDHMHEIFSMLIDLDESAFHAVKTVLRSEHHRCTAPNLLDLQDA